MESTEISTIESGERPGATPAPCIDHLELLLLTILRRFEDDAAAQYDACLRDFMTEEKKAFVARLRDYTPTDRPLDESVLAKPLYELLDVTSATEERSVLILQGLVLERVREAVYAVTADSPRISGEARALLTEGRQASRTITAMAPALVAQRIGEGDALYEHFASVSREALRLLDDLGQPVDDVFGDSKGLWFSDIIGEYASDLLPLCTDELHMSRRKVICHLTGAMMGI